MVSLISDLRNARYASPARFGRNDIGLANAGSSLTGRPLRASSMPSSTKSAAGSLRIHPDEGLVMAAAALRTAPNSPATVPSPPRGPYFGGGTAVAGYTASPESRVLSYQRWY